MKQIKTELFIPKYDIPYKWELNQTFLDRVKSSIAYKSTFSIQSDIQYNHIDEGLESEGVLFTTDNVMLTRQEYDELIAKVRIYDSIFERKLS